MKITAVTADQIILVDGIVANMREIGGFNMCHGEWAVHFDEVLGYGHVEYTDNRPNKPIEQVYFDQHFAWLKVEHQRYVDHVAAQERLEAEAAANDSDPIIEPGSNSDSL